ncbi:MAG TPA: BMP family ABC transporter substrate-binding protein [Jatrophihabitantaceae bacterium]|jgi:basic membrane protein A
MTAGVAALALLLGACGSKSNGSGGNTGGNGGTSAPASGGGSGGGGSASFKACMVTDTGGIDDKSFNASAWAGMQASGAQVSYVQSKTEADYTTNINNLLQQKCQLIVTVGGLMGTATQNAAKANPNQHFAEVDNPGNGTNWQGLQYNSAQGGFLGGYLAAGYSKTGKVATYGGLSIPPVTIYMDGFWEGVQYYNQVKHKNVQVLGWDEKTQKGSIVGGANAFTDQTKGQQLATNFVQQGADVIFPVAGGTGIGSAAYAQSSKKAVVIWVDTDGCESAAQYCPVFLSTVFKDVKGSVQKAVEDDAKGQFSSQDYIGTLSNGGTGLSPFHQFASKVPQQLQDELKDIQQKIVSGQIAITSKAQPK